MTNYHLVPWRTAGYFLLLGTAWILLTSQLDAYPLDPQLISVYERTKGIAFIACTAVFIFASFRAQIQRIVRTEEQLREAREQYTRELEERVAERTAELEATVAELEAFSHTVAHDLRAPVRTIDGFAYTLLEDHGEHLDEEAQAKIGRIRNGAKRMSTLIDDMLRLARIGNFEFSRERLDLAPIAEAILQDLQERDRTRKVSWKVQPELVVHGDRNLLRVMLLNVLENAWKYTGQKDGGQIEFGRTDRGGKAVFYIRDNGVGFAPESAKDIFKPFHRLDNVSDVPGSGIGLSTVERIVRRHGGRVEAEGEVGQGATIYLFL